MRMAREQKDLQWKSVNEKDRTDICDRLFKLRLYYKPHCEGLEFTEGHDDELKKDVRLLLQQLETQTCCWVARAAPSQLSCNLTSSDSTPAADQCVRRQLSDNNRSRTTTRFKP